MLEHTPSRTATLPLTGTLDVRHRLRQQQTWHTEWQQKDHLLEQIIFEVDETRPAGEQRGLQAITERIRSRLDILREPLEISPQLIDEMGYQPLRQTLDQQFAQLGKADRRLWLWNLLFIMTPDLRRLYDKVDRVRHYRSFGQQRNFLLGGPSGMGKTTCLDWFVLNHPPVVDAHRNRVPVVKVNAPYSNKSVHRLLRQIVLQCGKTYFQGDREGDLLDKVILYFQKCSVEILIVDEIQHLRTDGMKRRLLEISNETKGVPIICASCHPTEFVRGDPEIAGRWNDYFELEPYTGKRLEELLAFVELVLPFTQPSYLALRQLTQDKQLVDGPAAIIERCTDGILRDIMLLITEASLQAIERGDPALTPDLLKQAWTSVQENRVEEFLHLVGGSR
jgi:hypothetical protein